MLIEAAEQQSAHPRTQKAQHRAHYGIGGVMDAQIHPGGHHQQDDDHTADLHPRAAPVHQAAVNAACGLTVAAGEGPRIGKMLGIHQQTLGFHIAQVAEVLIEEGAGATDQILHKAVKAHGGVQGEQHIFAQPLIPAPVHADQQQDTAGLLAEEGEEQHHLIHHGAADALHRCHHSMIEGLTELQKGSHRGNSFRSLFVFPSRPICPVRRVFCKRRQTMEVCRPADKITE